ncbi:hypothetical protein LTR56_011956 [Elasticomyces elasticus]|nr:hypothetical protein LTR56_011956 [Elasticomyces elasticus]KAK3654776.1 hypothetical protein LTR22_010542 [Elasticomyces elasticus]KAK4920588.1 hypothetical protein LTR49_011835 [Elasticomyces elasticus]KAK5759384.1 hypothetical protein LTS12_010549 [Elasticomyces elasticus]
MAAGRTLKSLVGRRRRVDDEGEDDDGPSTVADSQSEGSVISDADDDDASSVAEAGATESNRGGAVEARSEASTADGAKESRQVRKPRNKGKKSQVSTQEQTSPEKPAASFKTVPDTEAMMNGLQIDEAAQAQEAVDFETMDHDTAPAPAVLAPPTTNGNTVQPPTQPRREHEEYRRKRDADPAFVPNRGNFFMHDTRAQGHGQQPPVARGGFAGRGRGRGGLNVGGPFSPANQVAQAERAAEQLWKHDLHDTINEEAAPQPAAKPLDLNQQRDRDDSARLFPKPIPPPGHSRVVNLSTTTLVGRVQIRVILPGAKAPIIFSEVPWKHYVRLPVHRPPLRRDKPVRVSLPDMSPHYIFPSSDRSFIFIPRQQRPNQGVYHRGGSYQRSVGGHGGFSSRRTSMYGGSMYASSMAGGSRRSSMAGVSRADAFSPASFASGMPPPNRPVVRMPNGRPSFSGVATPSGPMSGQHTPIGMPMIHTYPLPQQPTFQGTPTSTMHQPRPQKTISVTGIESPALLTQVPSNEAPAPFASQLPAHMAMSQPPMYNPQQQQQPYFSPAQQYGYPQHPSATPLSGIPEQAMHAQAFQPQMPYGQPPPYYEPYPQHQQQPYYYPPPGPMHGYVNVPPPMPMYMPPPQQGYQMMPPPGPQQMGMEMQSMPPQHMDIQQMPLHQPSAQQHYPPQEAEPQQASSHEQLEVPNSGSESGIMARESNGMVFYVPRSDIPAQGDEQQQTQQNQYAPAESFVPSYAMPGLMPPTPGPEVSGNMEGYYYPPMGMPMQEGGYYGQQ